MTYENMQLIKMPKIFRMEIGLWRSMTGLQGTITGECFETLVVSEIIKYIKTAGISARLGYYRTRSGMQMDLILEYNGKICGLEIKSRERIVPGDARQLKRLADALGERWAGGLVIYRGNALRQLTKNIWVISSYCLLG